MGKNKDTYYKLVKKLVKKYLSKVNQKQSISLKEIIEDFLHIDEIINYDMIERFILTIEKIGGRVIDKSALYKQNMTNNPSGNNHISSNMLLPRKNQAVTLYNNLVQKYLLKVNQNLPIDVFSIMEDYLEINSEIDYERIRKIVETLEKIGAKVINKEVLKNAAFLPATDDDVLTTSDMRYPANDQEAEYDDSSLQADVSTEDVISLLMKDIRNYPVLTPKEEYELAERLAAGDKEAKNKLILSNIRLVISIAKRYCNHSGILAKSVLLGTTYWEGVDVPGTALTSVICVRLPFPPRDPVLEAKEEMAKKEGKDPFRSVYLPIMMMKLKQGIGRLIRNHNDYGILSIIDKRVHIGQKSYTSLIRSLLEPSEITDDIKRVKRFLNWHTSNSKLPVKS